MSYYPPPQQSHGGPSYSQPLDPRLHPPPQGNHPPPHSAYSPVQAPLPRPPSFLPPTPTFDPYATQQQHGAPPPPAAYNAPSYGNERNPNQGYVPSSGQGQNGYAPPQGQGYGHERRDGPPPGGYSNNNNDRGYGNGNGRGNDRNERGSVGGGRGGRGGGGHDERRRSPDGRRDSGRLGQRDRNEKTPRADRESKCRTLFVRNVAYDAKIDWLRDSFGGFGEMKEFFDLVPRRGLIFITYYDLRAAERARQAMHNTEVEGRHIDVHYSLPKEADVGGPCGNDKNQGSILVTVRENGRLNEMELGKMCEQFGEVRRVHSGRTPTNKVVEFWDSRGAVGFFEQMNGKYHQGGPLVLRYLWDDAEPEPVLAAPPNVTLKPGRDGGRPPSPVRGGRDRYVPPPSDQGYASRGGAGRYDDRRGSYDRPPEPRRDFNQPPPDRYRESAPQAAPPPNDRFDQARRVQDLLSSLGGAATPAAPPVPPYPPRGGYAPAPGPPPTSNFGPPGGPPAGFPPPPGPYGAGQGGDRANGPNSHPPYDYGRPPPPQNQPPPQRYNPPPSSMPPPPQQYPPPVAGGYGYPPPPANHGGYGGPPPQQPPANDVASLLARLQK